MPVTHVPIVVTDAATATILADNSGLTHFMPDLTADCTITLPTASAGLTFKFVYNGAAADAHDWIFDTVSDSIYFTGGVTHIDLDGDSVAPVYADGNSNSIATILVPEVGTDLNFTCYDGTTWYVHGIVCSATVPTFTDQA